MTYISFLILSVALSYGSGDRLDYRYSPLGKYDNGYTEAKYNDVLRVLTETYEPIIENMGGSFHILKDWGDGAVNMWAERWGEKYRLEIPGGMSRYYLINEEAFVVSICHELGHLLGGAPMRGVISLEGQSDYFANQTCSKAILSRLEPFKDLPENKEVAEACISKEASALCERVLKGSLSLTSYYAEIENVNPPAISTKSAVRVDETLDAHPPAQCRLDTFVAGYFDLPRPFCWYKN